MPNASAVGLAEASSISKWFRIGFGICCGSAFLVILSRSLDMGQVFSLMRQLQWWPVIVGVTAYMLGFVFRSVRFWILVKGPEQGIALIPTISPFIASFGISDVLPLRVGDVFRIFWFNRSFNLPMGGVIAAMVIERLLDLFAIILLAVAALYFIDVSGSAEIMSIIQLVLLSSVLIGGGVILSPLLLERLASIVSRWRWSVWGKLATLLKSIANAVRGIGNVRRIIGLFGFSLLIWLLESMVMMGAWFSLGGQASSFIDPFFSFAISTLGTLVPALPGHFGSYEYFGILAFDATSVDRTFGAAVVLLSHLMLWLPTALFGIGWLLFTKEKLDFGFKTRL